MPATDTRIIRPNSLIRPNRIIRANSPSWWGTPPYRLEVPPAFTSFRLRQQKVGLSACCTVYMLSRSFGKSNEETELAC